MLPAAEQNYAAQKALTASTVNASLSLWQQVDPLDIAASYQTIWAQLVARLTASQTLAARLARLYVPAVLTAQGIDAATDFQLLDVAFSGLASDGRDLTSLLLGPMVTAKISIGQGQAPAVALTRGADSLVRIIGTQVADAGRAAESVGMATHPACKSWVRMLRLPSCSRCALLAGRVYRWSDGFKRHPLCDCRHIPSNENAAGDLTTDPLAAIKAGKVTGLSKADTKAIVEDGSDPAQVINAQRSLYTADAFGRQLASTREGVTKRGRYGKAQLAAGRSPGKSPRLRPEEIYRLADGDRAEALRLLKHYRYISS
jgi:hypothetical protein